MRTYLKQKQEGNDAYIDKRHFNPALLTHHFATAERPAPLTVNSATKFGTSTVRCFCTKLLFDTKQLIVLGDPV